MITTRRQTEYNVATENSSISSSNIDLLERKAPAAYNNYENKVVNDESYAEARDRMQKNLDRLLNYDRYSEINSEADTVAAEVQTETVSQTLEEDIRPSSTTMQFGDDNIENIYQDMNRQNQNNKEAHHLNKRGKLIVMLYTLTIAVIFALIVLNTGVLSKLSRQSQASAATLSAKIEKYNTINEQINSISSPEHIVKVAENEYGMIIK